MSQDTIGEDTPKTDVDKTTENNVVQQDGLNESEDQDMISKEDHKTIKGRIKDGYKKEIANLQSQIAKLEKEKEDSRIEDLKSQQKFEDLYKQEEQKRKDLETRLQSAAIQAAFAKESNDIVWQNADIAFNALDKSGVSVNEDGSVSGMDQAVKALVESNPFLQKNTKTPGVNTDTDFTTPKTDSVMPGVKYSESQVQALLALSTDERNRRMSADPTGWSEALQAYTK